MATLTDIQKKVRILLDHNEAADSIEGLGEDQLQLNDIITSQVEAAARLSILMAPRSYIDWISCKAEGEMKDGAYVIPLPDRFLRFGAARMSSWKVSVNTYYGMSDDAYAMQQSEFAGVRATSRLPVCVLCESEDGGNEMRLYPCVAGDSVAFFSFCTQPLLINDEIEIGDSLYEPFVYITAALVAEVLKDTDKSNELMAAAKLMLTNPDEVSETISTAN